MTNLNLNKLHQAIEFAKDKDLPDEDEAALQDVLEEELVSTQTFTISLFYDAESEEAHLVTKGERPRAVVEYMKEDQYLDLCRGLEIEENNDYNLSVSKKLGKGIHARIFAITRPISEHPNITISTSKEPPSTWNQIELTDTLKEIMDDNFLIVGASGAGKTYLKNYMLKQKHAGTKNKIGIIEEFNELVIPNSSTFRLSVPTAKPNQPRLLEFITEQSNLMRLDYLYVGEVKGSEAWPFLNNLASGTIGACTVHGSSVRDGLDRFKNLCLSAGAPESAVINGISKTIRHVIYVRDHQIRHIVELTKVTQQGIFQMKDIFKHSSEKVVGPTGPAVL